MKGPSKLKIRYWIYLATFLINFYAYSQDYYWVGNSGNWSDFSNHWATTSGGSTFHTTAPGTNNNVFFDENSFTEEGHTVTIDGGGSTVFCKDLNWTGALPANLDFTGDGLNDGVLLVKGSLTLVEDLNVSLKTISISPGSGTGNIQIDTKGVSLNQTKVSLNLQFRNVVLEDSISAREMTLFNVDNEFNLQGHPIHLLEKLSITGTIDGSLNFDNSRIYTRDFDFRPEFSSTDQLHSDNSEVHIVYPDGFTAIDKTLTTSAPIEKFYIHEDHEFAGVDPILDQLIVEKGVTLSSNTGVSEVEFNSLTAEGQRNSRITFYSQNGAEYIQNGGVVDVFFADLENITTSGGADFNAFASTAIGTTSGWDLQKIDQEISFDLDEDKTFENVGEVIDLEASVDSDLEVSFESSNEDVAMMSGSNELVIVGVGTAEITARQIGDEFYNEANPVIRLMIVSKVNQAITFGPIEDQWIGEERINLNATSDAGLDVSYHVLGPGVLDGVNVVFTGTGEVQITAIQAGNENYNAAEDVIVSFQVFKRSQTITFNEIDDTSEDDGFVNLDATSDSGLPVTYSVVGPGEVVDGAMEFTGSGMVQITAMQEGNDAYLAAEVVRRSFEIISSTSEKPLHFTRPEGLATVYPNPFTNHLNIDPAAQVPRITVSDLSGKVYFKGIPNNHRLDASGWESGIYVISIKSNNGEASVSRIIKN